MNEIYEYAEHKTVLKVYSSYEKAKRILSKHRNRKNTEFHGKNLNIDRIYYLEYELIEMKLT
jgi:hypothetical protein